MNQEINMPEFINKPEEYINMTKEEYNQDRRFLIYAVRKECQREYQKMLFKRSICTLLLTIIGLCYVMLYGESIKYLMHYLCNSLHKIL